MFLERGEKQRGEIRYLLDLRFPRGRALRDRSCTSLYTAMMCCCQGTEKEFLVGTSRLLRTAREDLLVLLSLVYPTLQILK